MSTAPQEISCNFGRSGNGGLDCAIAKTKRQDSNSTVQVVEGSCAVEADGPATPCQARIRVTQTISS